MRLRGVKADSIVEELVLIHLLMKEDYQKALVYELISAVGVNRDNKEAIKQVHKMLLKTIYPEVEKYEQERDDFMQSMLAEEAKKSYTFKVGGKPLKPEQMGMIGK